MQSKYLVTKSGLEKIKKELIERKTEVRKRIADKLETATAQGDLSENAAYTAALEEQQMNEAKIGELEEFIKNAKVIIPNSRNATIEVGERVILKDLDNKSEVEYELVGEEESDPLNNKLSTASPLGAKLLGKKVGDTLEIEAPMGIKKYKISKIKS